jgi:hypothetical protein
LSAGSLQAAIEANVCDSFCSEAHIRPFEKVDLSDRPDAHMMVADYFSIPGELSDNDFFSVVEATVTKATISSSEAAQLRITQEMVHNTHQPIGAWLGIVVDHRDDIGCDPVETSITGSNCPWDINGDHADRQGMRAVALEKLLSL